MRHVDGQSDRHDFIVSLVKIMLNSLWTGIILI
jgi:hypothetical protein